MGIDLSNLTLSELQKLAEKVKKAIATSEADRRKEARAAVKKVVKEYGISMDDILSDETAKPKTKTKTKKKAAPKRAAAAAKYRNPSDPKQTWSGKGRRPNWYVEAVESGKSAEELSI